MRVLWFSISPSLYKEEERGYGGKGWISSLEKAISSRSEIELGVAFFHEDSIFKVVKGNVCYYPIPVRSSLSNKIIDFLYPEKRDPQEIAYYLKIIDDFKPDVIHIFGTEYNFGLMSQFTDVSVVIYIQGLLTPCSNAYLPPGTFKIDYFRYLNIITALKKLKTLLVFDQNAKREERILKRNRYFMGRTEWDRDICKLFAPDAQYFYCSEILRDPFYSAQPWKYGQSAGLKLMSTLSKTDYKGFDLVLKAALLLKQQTNINFTWNVFGISSYKFWERKLKIKAADVGVKLRGVATPDRLITEMLDSDIFIHPSYIDNSPNSVCEAQMVGMPVIATNVGGISSLIQDGIDGVLVPANDPFMLLSHILELKNNSVLSETLGKKAREIAMKRHDREKIVADNIRIYNSLHRV